jgi:tRNA A-37 threonylcarbamoyl transferase component Bud32
MNESLPIDENEFARRLERLENAARKNEPLEVDSPDSCNAADNDSFTAAAEVVGMIHRVRRAVRSTNQDTAENELDTPAQPAFSADELADQIPVPNADHWSAPTKIGRFQIQRPLGQGGYGLVFRAYDPQLDRDVAIKVPRIEAILNEEMASRFTREARAAAALSHPNIVPVFESGSAGRICFIAYQFVDGITLSQWLDQLPENELPDPGQAAALVAKLADAAHHAHQRGVLHRDLKPANVMLTESTAVEKFSEDKQTEADDRFDAGDLRLLVPMITDFGLAKIVATDELPNDTVADTRTGSLVGTPAYMAPEHVRAQKELIGPATDVYSLGVLFYELLTRNNPFVRDSLIQTMDAVQNEDPGPPGRINRKISRDLDAIVLKCVEKEVSKRYATAADLRADLERYLNREPVQARRITAVTRTARWVSRNRLVAALLVLLALGMVGTTIGLMRARQAENDARVAEKAAVVEAGTAATVSEFLEDIFDVPDLLGSKPGQQRGKEISAEDILKHGATRIRNELDDQPEVKARLMTKIGSILVKLGSYEEGENLLRDGLALGMNVLDANHPQVAESHRQLAKVLLLREQTAEAKDELRTAIRILESDEASNRQKLSVAYNDLGLILKARDPRGARVAYQRALDLRAGDSSTSLWRLQANIAAIDARLADYENARNGFERAFEAAKESYETDDHPAIATIMNNLAFVHRKLGNYYRARQLQERNLNISEKKLGNDHPQVGSALIGLTAICQRLGDYDAASEYGRRAIEVNSNSLPPEHRNITIAMTHHAETLMRIGDYENARTQMDEAQTQLELREDPEAAIQRIRNLLLLSTIERKSGNAEGALTIIDQILADPAVDDDLTVGMTVRMAQALLLAQLRDERAESAYVDALQFAEQLSSLSPADQAYFQARFWALFRDSGKALTYLNQAVDSGYRDAILLTDPDLEFIRDEQRYAQLAGFVEKTLGDEEN